MFEVAALIGLIWGSTIKGSPSKLSSQEYVQFSKTKADQLTDYLNKNLPEESFECHGDRFLLKEKFDIQNTEDGCRFCCTESKETLEIKGAKAHRMDPVEGFPFVIELRLTSKSPERRTQ